MKMMTDGETSRGEQLQSIAMSPRIINMLWDYAEFSDDIYSSVSPEASQTLPKSCLHRHSHVLCPLIAFSAHADGPLGDGKHQSPFVFQLDGHTYLQLDSSLMMMMLDVT